MPKNARDLARHVLNRVRRDGAYANLALSAALDKNDSLPLVEKSLATELVYGVLRHQRRLDHALSQLLTKPLERLDEETIDALRLAAYQLLLLERIPHHAAVNDAVGAIRRARGANLAGVANAVLRRLSREGTRLESWTDEQERLGIEYSWPEDLAEYFLRQLGAEQSEQLGQSLLQRAPLTARINLLRATKDEIQAALQAEGAKLTPARYCDVAYRIEDLAQPFAAPSYWRGLWTVQDEAAQLVSSLVDPQPGETIIDACAGLGGKSGHLASMMGNRGQIFCLDTQARKLQLLQENCRRLGVEICTPQQVDLRNKYQLAGGGLADRILLDAPCSGLGVLRRHPEHKWRRPLDSLGELVELQRQLIDNLIICLRPGGIFVYSVCTTTDEEGLAQVTWLTQKYPQLQLAPLESEPWNSLQENGMVRLWPHRHQTDGFFMARFVLSC